MTPVTRLFALMFTALAAAAPVQAGSSQSAETPSPPMPELAAVEFAAGMRPLEVAAPEGGRALSGYLWYPAAADAPLQPAYANPVWVAPQVAMEAAPAAGRYPLVVLSHGLFGNALNQSWLAAALARRGHVVAAISHPGTSTWLRDAEDRRRLWQRPGDISQLISHVLADPALAALTDPERIYMAGHSLGGHTAALLAGARYAAAHMAGFCAKQPEELTCRLVRKWQVAGTAPERQAMEADLSDPRIRAFALFDLGPVQTLSPASLGEVKRPLLVCGAPVANSGMTLDIEARALMQALPEGAARYIEPETLAHFDFLGECKPGALEILASEEPGDEVICMGGGAERAAKHRMIIDETAAFFARH
jgi:predicted dienelactone hydrolase